MKHKSILKILTVSLVILALTISALVIGTMGAAAAETAAWDGTAVDTAWYNTTDTSFEIGAPAELAGLAAIVNGTADGITKDTFAGKTITLTADIDLGSEEWTPIGATPVGTGTQNPFQGTFDGNGKTVSNLKISRHLRYAGLFGFAQGAVISDVTVQGTIEMTKNSSETVGNPYVGGIVGQAHMDTDSITNCKSQVNISFADFDNTFRYAGGIAGACYGIIDSCIFDGTVTDNGGTAGQYGGIVEYVGNTGIIRNCVSKGTIGPGKYLGGIACRVQGTVENCYNASNVLGGESQCAGGIAHQVLPNGVVQNCYSIGSVSGEDSESGALAGYMVEGYQDERMPENSAEDAVVQNCYYLASSYATAVGTSSVLQPTNSDKFENAADTVVYKGSTEMSLTDALKAYVTASGDSTLKAWKVSGTENNSYPVLVVPHTHSWATVLSSDVNGHWYACTADGCDITDYSTVTDTGCAYTAHSAPADDNNCITVAKCATCEYVFTEGNEKHSYTYTASGAVITETCSNNGCTAHTAMATIAAPTGELVAGDANIAATITYSDNWAGEKPDVAYLLGGAASENVNAAGNYKASITIGGATISVDFTVKESSTETEPPAVPDTSEPSDNNLWWIIPLCIAGVAVPIAIIVIAVIVFVRGKDGATGEKTGKRESDDEED